MGTFNDSGYFTVKQDGKVVASLDMDFLYESGCPTMVMPARWKKPHIAAPRVPEKTDYSEEIMALLGDLNLCSREFKSRMYDGEVKGLSGGTLVGQRADVPSDATVLRVDYQSRMPSCREWTIHGIRIRYPCDDHLGHRRCDA